MEKAKVDRKRGDVEFELMFSVLQSISKQRLYKPGSDPVERKFITIKFVNKGIDYLNISNILRNKKVMQQIPPYFLLSTPSPPLDKIHDYPDSGISANLPTGLAGNTKKVE